MTISLDINLKQIDTFDEQQIFGIILLWLLVLVNLLLDKKSNFY